MKKSLCVITLMGTVSIFSLSVSSSANAQQASNPASAPPVESVSANDSKDIIVTGFRASLRNALDNKRKSNLIIESIAPEDIGKFSDQNVSESLQRLPGVQIDRANGQGTSVLIDGLRQNLTTLNGDVFLTGKEFSVSGEGAGGGNGGGKEYGSLEGVPSDEIGGIDVYKSPQASLTEGGIGGIINLKTRDPLSSKIGLSLGGNLRGTLSTGANQVTPDGSLIVTYKMNGDFAVTAGISYNREKTVTHEFQDANRSQWAITDSATGPYVGALTAAGITHLGTNYIDPQLAYFTNQNDDRKTLGATLGLAYRISPQLRTDFNWFYSNENDINISYSDKVWFNGAGAGPSAGAAPLIPGIDPTLPYSIDSHGVVQSATFNANGAETATLFQQNKSHANNFQWVTKYDSGSGLRVSLDGAYSKANSNLQASQADVEHGLYNNHAGVPTSPAAPGCNNGASTCTNLTGNHGYEFSYANGGTSGLPSVSYLAPYSDVLTNPAYTTFKSNWAWANLGKQTQWAAKVDLQYDPAFLKDTDQTLSAGFRYSDRKVDQNFGRYLEMGPGGTPIANCCQSPNGGNAVYYLDPGYADIPYSTALSNPSLAQTVNNFAVGNIVVKNPYTGGQTNPSTYLNTVYNGAGVPNNTEALYKDTLSSFKVKEQTVSGYIMDDIGGRDSRFHANFGLRFVSTNLTVDGAQTAPVPTFFGTAIWNGVNSNNIPTETKRSYVDILPSLNFSLKPSDHEILRFAAARVVSPQDLFSLGLGNSYGFTRQTGARVNTNPTSALLGQKDGFAFNGGSSGNANLDPYRASQFYIGYENYFAKGGYFGFSGFWKEVDNIVEIANVSTTINDDFGGTTANVTKPINAGSGRIYGLELSGQFVLNDGVFKGLGFAGNYTYSQSKLKQSTSFSDTSTIPGVSKHSVTASGFYENNGFSIRASYSWRSKAVNDSGVGQQFSFANATGTGPNTVYQIYQAPYGQLDGQIGYDLNKHAGLVFSVQNLTKAAQHTYLQYPNLPFTYDNSGRRIFFGVKFKL